MTYELRKLKASDLFALAGIIGKIGIKDLAKSLPTEKGEEVDPSQIAFAVAGVVAENADKVEADVYKFLGDLSGLTPKQVGNLSPVAFVELIKATVELDDFAEFFTQVSTFVK